MFDPCVPIIHAGGAVVRAFKHAVVHKARAALGSPAASIGAGPHLQPSVPHIHHALAPRPPLFGPPAPKVAAACGKAPGSAVAGKAAAGKLGGSKLAALGTEQFGAAFYNSGLPGAQLSAPLGAVGSGGGIAGGAVAPSGLAGFGGAAKSLAAAAIVAAGTMVMASAPSTAPQPGAGFTLLPTVSVAADTAGATGRAPVVAAATLAPPPAARLPAAATPGTGPAQPVPAQPVSAQPAPGIIQATPVKTGPAKNEAPTDDTTYDQVVTDTRPDTTPGPLDTGTFNGIFGSPKTSPDSDIADRQPSVPGSPLVSVNQVIDVPEPASFMVLLAAGGATLLARRQRR